MSKDGEFLASSGAGFGPSPTTAILETQVGVPTSSESDVFPSVVQDRVPPRGPGTTVDMDSALLRGQQGSLAPSLPVSVSADSAIPMPGGSRRHSGSAARGTDRHSSTASVRPLADVLSRRSSDLECLDELARHESDSSGAGRKRSASPSRRSSRRDVTAHVGATPPGMIRGELTGALYADSRASDRFPRKASSSSTGRRHHEDAPTLRPPDKSGAPTGSSSVKRQSRSDAKRQDSSPPRWVVSRTPPPRSYGAYKEGRRSRSKSPHRSSRRRRQRSHRSCARPRCSETHDSRSRGRSEAGRGHREPSAYDKPPGPHGVERRRPSPPVFGRRHYPSHPGCSALNRQHTEFRSHQSGAQRIAEGALSQVALQQRKLKKQAKDKKRKLQKRLHDIDVATEEKIRKVDRGDHCAFSPVFYDVPQSQDSSLHPPDSRPGSSVVVTPDASLHYYSFPSPPPGRQVVVHDYETTQSVKITVPATRSATVTSEPRPVPSFAQLSCFRPEDIPADAIVTPVLPLTDTKLISALDTPLVSTTTALPAYSPVPLLPPASVSPADPPPWYRQLVADAVSAFRAQLPNIPPVSAAATITSPDEGVDDVQLPRLDIVRSALSQGGFSEWAAKHIAVPQRSSTRLVYEGKWAEFCAWCDRRKEDPVQASVPLVADFLTELLERIPPLAVSTIRGYRSAISSTVPHGPSLTNSQELGALMRSFAKDRPVTRVFYPLGLSTTMPHLRKSCRLQIGLASPPSPTSTVVRWLHTPRVFMTLDLLWQRSRWLRIQRHRTDSPGGNILRVDFRLPPCTVFWSFTV